MGSGSGSVEIAERLGLAAIFKGVRRVMASLGDVDDLPTRAGTASFISAKRNLDTLVITRPSNLGRRSRRAVAKIDVPGISGQITKEGVDIEVGKPKN